MPEQEATITVTVEDEWGGRTTKSFTVTVGALVYGSQK